MWTCPKCGEEIEDQFDSCWKCAAQPEKQTARPSKTSRRWKLAFLAGILFEIVLFLLGAVLPEDSWLCYKLGVFVHWTHLPAIWLATHFLYFGLVSLLIVPLAMVSVWAFLFYHGLRLGAWLMNRTKLSKRQKLFIGGATGSICLVVFIWAIIDASGDSATPFTASHEVKSAVEGNTAFALDLYQKLKEKPGNLFFSPYSISTGLAMTYAGARGNTETEMARTAHFKLPQEQLHAAFAELTTRMSEVQRRNRITLITANSLWCQKDYKFTNTFLNLIQNCYKADARPVDFRHAPQTASDEINSWVEKKTNGKIKGVISPAKFDGFSKLVLCNAIYFKGKWQMQFKPKDTKPAPFYIDESNTVTVPMMSQKAHFKTAYADEVGIKMLELPYSGKNLSMIILLPNTEYRLPDVEQIQLTDVEQKLTAENLRGWLAKLDQAGAHETWVGLPRFTTSQSFELKTELKALGMRSAFDDPKDSADFSGMDGTTNLYVSEAIHKTFVEVNEAGTEAAAATLIQAKTRGGPDRFVVDHPFIFLIRENGSGSILFLGRIVDPTRE